MAKVLVRGRKLRATKLDGCGNPKLGPSSKVVTDGFITVGLTANTEEGEAIQLVNAAGVTVINDQPEPQFLNWTVEATLIGVDPELLSLMTGMPVRLSADGTEVVGFAVNSKVDLSKSGFALEMWTGTAGDVCAEGEDVSYGYLLLPFLKGGSVSDISVENGAINFGVSNARTKDGNNWGVGPYDVTLDEDDAAGPLNDPADPDDHLIQEFVSVAPPANTDGAEALGVPATLITAGIPATLTPANSYPPASLATMGAVTKSPTTAWTTGQGVLLQDGTYAHWTGSAWAAGVA